MHFRMVNTHGSVWAGWGVWLLGYLHACEHEIVLHTSRQELNVTDIIAHMNTVNKTSCMEVVQTRSRENVKNATWNKNK
jgi:hypothetical protein